MVCFGTLGSKQLLDFFYFIMKLEKEHQMDLLHYSLYCWATWFAYLLRWLKNSSLFLSCNMKLECLFIFVYSEDVLWNVLYFFIWVLSEQYNTSEFSFQPFFECIVSFFPISPLPALKWKWKCRSFL